MGREWNLYSQPSPRKVENWPYPEKQRAGVLSTSLRTKWRRGGSGQDFQGGRLFEIGEPGIGRALGLWEGHGGCSKSEEHSPGH